MDQVSHSRQCSSLMSVCRSPTTTRPRLLLVKTVLIVRQSLKMSSSFCSARAYQLRTRAGSREYGQLFLHIDRVFDGDDVVYEGVRGHRVDQRGVFLVSWSVHS